MAYFWLQESAEEVAAKAKAKRASMVKKALRYFEDKSNRSMSEDNLFTRRKNLAVHLGLDDKVSLREIQKINTYSLPVPSSATPFNPTAGASPRYHTGAKTHILSWNSLDFDILWILWKMRFSLSVPIVEPSLLSREQ